MVRAMFDDQEFIEIFVDTPIETCEARDTKGLYEKARKGIIKDFTGIDSPYEKPDSPEIRLDTRFETVDEEVNHVLSYLKVKKLIRS